MVEDLIDVAVEESIARGDQCAAHDLHGVDGEMRIAPEAGETVLVDEQLGLAAGVLALVLDALELDHGWLVVGQLEDAAEQHRNIGDLHAGPCRKGGQDLVAEIGVGAAEIEVNSTLGLMAGSAPC